MGVTLIVIAICHDLRLAQRSLTWDIGNSTAPPKPDSDDETDGLSNCLAGRSSHPQAPWHTPPRTALSFDGVGGPFLQVARHIKHTIQFAGLDRTADNGMVLVTIHSSIGVEALTVAQLTAEAIAVRIRQTIRTATGQQPLVTRAQSRAGRLARITRIRPGHVIPRQYTGSRAGTTIHPGHNVICQIRISSRCSSSRTQ